MLSLQSFALRRRSVAKREYATEGLLPPSHRTLGFRPVLGLALLIVAVYVKTFKNNRFIFFDLQSLVADAFQKLRIFFGFVYGE